jgi:hypothetical protein
MTRRAQQNLNASEVRPGGFRTTRCSPSTLLNELNDRRKENCACFNGRLKPRTFHPQISQIFTDWCAATFLY